MSFKHLFAKAVKNTMEEAYTLNSRHAKITEFKDPRRVEIYNSVELSDEQKDAIDSFFLENYGKKISYIWHRHCTAFTGNFDLYYFPEILYIPEFERYMNLERDYCKSIEDKNFLPYLAKAAGVKTAKTLFSSTAGLIKDSEENIISWEAFLERSADLGLAFIKPSKNTSSGDYCQVLDLSHGFDRLSGLAISKVPAIAHSDDWVIQERLQCHSSISDIYALSVNTFRIITYRWKNEICHIPVAMRIGGGGRNVDNVHSDGMFIAVEDNGKMHETAFSEFLDRYTSHPDTGLIFKNHIIPDMPKVIEAAYKMHRILPQIGVINWDFTIDRDGDPVLIEANSMGGSIDLAELSHGKAIFGDKTPEVLRWMKFMRSISKTERSKYSFGKMPE